MCSVHHLGLPQVPGRPSPAKGDLPRESVGVTPTYVLLLFLVHYKYLSDLPKPQADTNGGFSQQKTWLTVVGSPVPW